MADTSANGSIIRYPHLSTWQRDKGETEGRKAHPVCMVLAIPKGNRTNLILRAVSGTPPRSDQPHWRFHNSNAAALESVSGKMHGLPSLNSITT